MKKALLALLAMFIFVLAVVLGAGAKQNEGDKMGYQLPEPSKAVEATVPSTVPEPPEQSTVPETPKPIEAAVEVDATEPPKLASDREIELIARTIWGEAEIVQSRAEQAAVAWCILNRVDSSGKTIESVITAPYQFYCRTDDNLPSWALELAEDVLWRWGRERAGETNVGRTLPADYLYFIGDGWRNHFSIEWKSTDYWDWSLPDPYDN